MVPQHAKKDDQYDGLRQLFPDKKSVLIYPDDFDEANKDIVFSDLVDRHSGHFSDRRVAVLFRPGRYHNINFPVGYWTQVLGLGETPRDVVFTGQLGVYALPANTQNPNVGSLDTFWRSAENFTSQTSFVQDPVSKKWCVPIPSSNHLAAAKDTEDTTTTSPYSLYPVGDLADPEYGYPSQEVPNFSPQFGMMWAVSQAAPLRRVQIGGIEDSKKMNMNGNLHLSLGDNCASGGFLGNVHIANGYLLLGSQQQYCIRNCSVKQKAAGGAWSFVLIGSKSDGGESGDDDKQKKSPVKWAQKPGLDSPNVAYEETTRSCIEKPFLFFRAQDSKTLYLGIPKLQKNTVGINHDQMDEIERVPIEWSLDSTSKVRVFTPQHTYKECQKAADDGCHMVLNPGTYHWKKTLYISNSNQVVLGIGMATIQAPGDGSPCIHVASSAQGVRISGLSLEASAISTYKNSTLLQWGDDNKGKAVVGTTEASAANPGAIHDLYCFVGGRSLDRTVRVETMVKIFSNHVILDNIWLWRADHVKLKPGENPNRPELSEYHVTEYGECRCDVGLEVWGDHVTCYGLAVEHVYQDMVKWHGEYGQVLFYQSELPYDVSGSVYRKDVAGYRVHSSANHHVAKGVGVYSYFRDHKDVVVDSAVVHEAGTGFFENTFTVWLNGYRGLDSVINKEGEGTKEQGKPYVVPVYIASHCRSSIIAGPAGGWLLTWMASLWNFVWGKVSFVWNKLVSPSTDNCQQFKKEDGTASSPQQL